MTTEQVRILRAAAEDRLVSNAAGRWVIVGEARPDRKSLEALLRRGLLDYSNASGRGVYGRLALTVTGRRALREASA